VLLCIASPNSEFFLQQMRPGIPLIPILKQQRAPVRDSTGSKADSLRSTPRPSSARHSEASTPQQDDQCDASALKSRPAWGLGVREQNRRSAGSIGRRPAKNRHLGAGSTGGTGSCGNIAGAPGASPLSAFWSQIDDLDSGLQVRVAAAQMPAHIRTGKFSSAPCTPKDATFLQRGPTGSNGPTPDTSANEISFVQTPQQTPQDTFFSETPQPSVQVFEEDASMDVGSLTFEETPARLDEQQSRDDVSATTTDNVSEAERLDEMLAGGAAPRLSSATSELESGDGNMEDRGGAEYLISGIAELESALPCVAPQLSPRGRPETPPQASASYRETPEFFQLSPQGRPETSPQASASYLESPEPALLCEESPEPALRGSPQASAIIGRALSQRGGQLGVPSSRTTLNVSNFKEAAAKRTRTPPGVGNGSSRGGVRGRTEGPQSENNVDHLTSRIRELEGDLEHAFDALCGRDRPVKPRQVLARTPRRAGSAPADRRRPQQPSAWAAQPSFRKKVESPQVALSSPSLAPEVAPRSMCREMLGEAEGAANLDTGVLLQNAMESQGGLFRTDDDVASSSDPARLLHICQMMQMERRAFLDQLQDVCRKCHVDFEASASSDGDAYQTGEASPDHVAGAKSPRTLLNILCDAHLGLRARCAGVAEGAAAARARLGSGERGQTQASCGSDASPSMVPSTAAVSPVGRLLRDSSSLLAFVSRQSIVGDGPGLSGGANTSALDPAASASHPFAAAASQPRSISMHLAPQESAPAPEERTLFAPDSATSLLSATSMPLAPHESVMAPEERTLFAPESAASLFSVPESVATVPPADSVRCDDSYACFPLTLSAPAASRQMLVKGSPQSSVGSLPAVGRLQDLVEEKRREVGELAARCEQATSDQERVAASTLHSAAREELRLLREFLGEGEDAVLI